MIREKKKARRRERMLAAAAELFTSRGFRDTSVEEIAERAELAVGTFYNYFESKSQILIEIVGDEADRHFEEMDRLRSAPSEDVIHDACLFIDEFIKLFESFPKPVWRAVVASSMQEPTFGRAMLQLRADFIGRLRALLGAPRRKAWLEDAAAAEDLATAIHAIMLVSYLVFIMTDDMTFEEFKLRIHRGLGTVLNGAVSRAPSGADG